MTIDDQGRPEPSPAVGELETLVGFLEFHRATLQWKTRGLTDEELRRTTAASTMTLGGLLMHVAYVEDAWFGGLSDAPRVAPWSEVDWKTDPDWEWHIVHTMPGADVRAQWNTSVQRSRDALAAALRRADTSDPLGSLSQRGWPNGERPSLRWVLVHMIEEYARHNGHADLLREAIDGQRGE